MNIAGINIENINQYKSNSELIIKLIKKTYVKEEIIIDENLGIDFYSVNIGHKIKITIMPDDNWTIIKKNIDLILNVSINSNENICRLCGINMKSKTKCNKCNKFSCIECYIKNFNINKGIVKCDNCSYSFGILTPDEYLDILSDDIRKMQIK